MVALVESVMGIKTTVFKQVDPNFLTSVDEAENIAGFDVLEPQLLPDDFPFSYAIYNAETHMVILYYGMKWGSTGLVILQRPLSAVEQPLQPEMLPPGAVETVAIGDETGYFISGSFEAQPTNAPGEPTPAPIWRSDSLFRLIWESQHLRIQISFTGNLRDPGRLGKAEMVAVAESMRRCSAVA